MRLMFYRPASSHFPTEAPLPFQVNLPVSSSSSMEAYGEAFSLVGNPGNMIHRMAMVQALKFNRRQSSALSLIRLLKIIGLDETVKIINENYDAAVFTFSNIVNPDADEPQLSDIIRRINIPVVAIGIGIQEEFPADLSELKPSVRDLFLALDEKAVLFGVRGDSTKDWLNRAGLKTPVAVGCPSMFVYPRNIYHLTPPKKIDSIISAGHMGAVNLRENGNKRGTQLIQGFAAGETHPKEISYVFQGEMRHYPSLKKNIFSYNEATSTIDFEAASTDIEKFSGRKQPFTKFYSFNDVAAWRQACMRYDVFIGDRIHGAVAAMQAGVPALVLHSDLRVRELTAFHGIPNCSLEEFSEIGYQAAAKKYLTEEAFELFRKRYALVLQNFAQVLSERNLELAIMPEISSVLTQHQESAATAQPPLEEIRQDT